MPETFPGFLVIAGLILFVFSLFSDPIRFMENEIPVLERSKRITLAVIGILLFAAGSTLYAFGVIPPFALQPQAAETCMNIEGKWKRDSDGLIVEYTQSDCTIRGRVVTDEAGNSHEVHAVLTGNSGIGYTRRVFEGCTTILSGEYLLLSDEQLRVKATSNGCELINYSENPIYRKLNQ
ncbi:MAG: hypothetical protein AB2689_19685 [Candidatus Thiodiazotropha taylori]